MSHVLYPAQGETFGGLVRRVMDGLAPAARARAEVVTGGERFGLVIPAATAPLGTPSAAVEDRPTVGRKPTAPRRRATPGKEVTV